MQAVDRFVSLTGRNVAPFTDWASAATNIQDAISAGSAGDTVWVTNGTYNTGGIVVTGGFLTNRVAIIKALTVRSVNGPQDTIIQGTATPGMTNGSASVRCIWVSSNAVLSGFTLTGGTTLNTSSDFNGGGAFCQSSNSIITNCIIIGNSSAGNGGGIYQGSIWNCAISNNFTAGSGGGSFMANLNGCTVSANSAVSGGGAYKGSLYACELTQNLGRNNALGGNSGGGMKLCSAQNCRILNNSGNGAETSFLIGCYVRGNTPYGSMHSTNINCTVVSNNIGIYSGASTNCIVWFNSSRSDSGGGKWRCLIQPDELYVTDKASLRQFPNFLSDGLHLAADSPAIGQGMIAAFSSNDLDGQPWSNPISIGCDEWQPQPLLVSQPRMVPGFASREAFTQAEFAGLAPYCFWSKDGVPIENDSHYTNAHTANVTIRDFGIADHGAYQVIASNNFGMVTSAVVFVNVSCVDSAGSNPTPPYNSWGTAANNIQDAIDAAQNGTIILVTNGVYSSGGRYVSGDMTNRMVLDKPISVLGINGPAQTIIEGAWDPSSTNGPLSVRCAWIMEGARVGGFTLRNGSTPSDGGGIWSLGSGLQETVVNCIITNCRAGGRGGGAYQGRLKGCIIAGNVANGNGGGAALAVVEQSLVQNNIALGLGGGIYGGVTRGVQLLANSASVSGGGAAGLSQSALLVSCAIAFNTATNFGGATDSLLYQCTVVSNTATGNRTAGVAACDVWNSILYFNSGVPDPTYGMNFANVAGSGTYHSVCTFPFSFIGSITNDPQLLDASHLAATSPCRGTGTNFGVVGFGDLDGDVWLAPPAIGCDQLIDSAFVGPLTVQLSGWPEVAVGAVFPLAASITGRASQWKLDFGDGTVVSNSVFGITHVWTNSGDYIITGTAFNSDHSQGVSSTLNVHVAHVLSPVLIDTVKSGSTFSMKFISQAGLSYELFGTTDLLPPIQWQSLQTLTSTGGVMTAMDTNAQDVARFYRLMIHY